MLPTPPSVFDEPAPSPVLPVESPVHAVLDPFSVYQKGEAILRRQLSVLSAWHLVNIAVSYELNHRPYDHREQFTRAATAISGSELAFTQHRVQLTWKHHWDAQRRT